MSRKFRFCDVCRGSDQPFVRCSLCARPYHVECIGFRSEQAFTDAHKSSPYACLRCDENNGKGNGNGNGDSGDEDDGPTPEELLEREDKAKELKAKLSANKVWASKITDHKKCYIWANRDMFGRFCDVEAIAGRGVAAKDLKARQEAFEHGAADRTDFLQVTESPTFIQNARLRGYQLEGVSTLCSWYYRGIGGILGDEMGLGKTIQTIAFLGSLKQHLKLNGPHLVITPLAVLQNWANELTRFAPNISFRKIHGSMSERRTILEDDRVVGGQYDVYLTTYDMIVVEEPFFSDSWPWVTVTLDEGHRIKDDTGRLRGVLNRIRSPFRLLLTGTPLQNNMHELWALLNFILPDIFRDSREFDEAFNSSKDTIHSGTCLVARALLEDHMMFRRLKSDVEALLLPKLQCQIYVPMTQLQRRWYASIMSRTFTAENISMLTAQQMLHLLSQIRKVVNHPKQIVVCVDRARLKDEQRVQTLINSGSEFYRRDASLIPPPVNSEGWIAEQELRQLSGLALINSTGKMRLMDRLLLRLKQAGSRCLIFSQFTETLDIIEEYVNFRFGKINEAYFRLDGSTNRLVREMSTRAFNAPGSQAFLFLISTTAGGMGINLATADSVILYDSSWNPQVDLQAQDRAHRIGQKKQVIVYRLVTTDTVEERILQSAEKKMLLDRVVIAPEASGKLKSAVSAAAATANNDDEHSMNITELRELLNYGQDKLLGANSKSAAVSTRLLESDEALDALIQRAVDRAHGIATAEPEEVAETIDESSDASLAGAGAEADTSNTAERPNIGDPYPSSSTLTVPVPATDSGPESIAGNSISNNSNQVATAHPAQQKPSEKAASSAFSNEVVYLDGSERDDNDDPSRTGTSRPKRARNAPNKFAPPLATASKKSRKRSHEEVCFLCDDGGLIIECGLCPKSYHLECVNLTSAPKGRWACPWHSCRTCSVTSSNSGGMQLRCLDCPTAFCFDCFPTDMELKGIDPPREFVNSITRHGYDISKSIVYLRCKECAEEHAKKEEAAAALRAKQEEERLKAAEEHRKAVANAAEEAERLKQQAAAHHAEMARKHELAHSGLAYMQFAATHPLSVQPVEQLFWPDTVRYYPNVLLASNYLNIGVEQIAQCCNGQVESIRGWVFRNYAGPPINWLAIESQQYNLDDMHRLSEALMKTGTRPVIRPPLQSHRSLFVSPPSRSLPPPPPRVASMPARPVTHPNSKPVLNRGPSIIQPTNAANLSRGSSTIKSTTAGKAQRDIPTIQSTMEANRQRIVQSANIANRQKVQSTNATNAQRSTQLAITINPQRVPSYAPTTIVADRQRIVQSMNAPKPQRVPSAIQFAHRESHEGGHSNRNTPSPGTSIAQAAQASHLARSSSNASTFANANTSHGAIASASASSALLMRPKNRVALWANMPCTTSEVVDLTHL